MKTRIDHTRRPLTRALAIALLTAALAAAGCASDDTPLAPVTRAALDTAPPAVPTGLTAAAVNSTVKVAWQPNTTDPDFAGFMLYRLAFGQAWPLLDAPTLETRYLDRSPLNRPCSYAVAAVDIHGNESAWLEIPFRGVPELPDRERN